MTSVADTSSSREMCPVELLWIPLGAGQHVVRLSGRAFGALTSFVQHRPACDRYHSALVVTVSGGRYVIEMTPVPDRRGYQRGVVAEGAVGSAWLGKLRVFRYEIHCWRNGVIPDAEQATATTALQLTPADAQRLLDLVPMCPRPCGAETISPPARCGTRTPSPRGSCVEAASIPTSLRHPTAAALPAGMPDLSSRPAVDLVRLTVIALFRQSVGAPDGPDHRPG